MNKKFYLWIIQMSFRYQYSFVNDFGNSFNNFSFMNEINDNQILPSIGNIFKNGETINLYFNQELTPTQITELDSLVANHNSDKFFSYDHVVKVDPTLNKINNSDYRRVSTFIYGGSNNIGPIKKIMLVGNKDSSVNNYSIKIYDTKNNLTLAENTFTNNNEEILELTPITNIPMNTCLLEVLARKIGGGNNGYIYLETITMYI